MAVAGAGALAGEVLVAVLVVDDDTAVEIGAGFAWEVVVVAGMVGLDTEEDAAVVGLVGEAGAVVELDNCLVGEIGCGAFDEVEVAAAGLASVAGFVVGAEGLVSLLFKLETPPLDLFDLLESSTILSAIGT